MARDRSPLFDALDAEFHFTSTARDLAEASAIITDIDRDRANARDRLERLMDGHTAVLDEFAEPWAEFFQPAADEDDEADGPALGDLLDLLIMLREFAECLPRAQQRRLRELLAPFTAW